MSDTIGIYNLQQLEDGKVKSFYPRTHEEAVIDNEGNTAGEKFTQLSAVTPKLVENPGFLEVEVDADDKILEGTTKDNKKIINKDVEINGVVSNSVKEEYAADDAEERLSMLIDGDKKVISYRKKDGTLVENNIETKEISAGNVDADNGQFKEISAGPVTISNNGIDNSNDIVEIAAGSKSESSINDSEYFVKIDTIKNIGYFDKKYNKNMLAVNHDDFRLCDIVGVRQIYNKYGFSGNFNFMLVGFESVQEKEKRIDAVKKLLREGHKIGLHNYFGASYWWMNKLFDIRPDGTSTYALTLEELQGPNNDHTGVNAFGVNVTSTTTLNQCCFENLPSDLGSLLVVNMTESSLRTVIANCCVAFNRQGKLLVDLEDKMVSKSTLRWAEYWYNNLIDDTLDYTPSGNYATLYADRTWYLIPDGADVNDYYPDAEHLENGKIVFFDDINNPHYSDADYQKVGRIAKGLFKGCATTRNCEVAGKIIDVAVAFCRHYYNMTYFENFGRHGEFICSAYWKDANNVLWENREKTILCYETQKVFMTEKGEFKSLFEVLKDHNIKMCNYGNGGKQVGDYQKIGQQKLFIGQSDISGDFFNQADFVEFLDFFGKDGDKISVLTYDEFASFANEHKNWLKWAYENAGSLVTNSNGDTMRMFDYIKKLIDVIKGNLGTGKITVASLDTIRQAPNVMAAVEIICQFCWENDISIVPMEVARKAANVERALLSNMFPNPGFNRCLLPMFGSSSTKTSAYLPDGWNILNNVGYEFTVSTNQDNGRREFTVEVNSGASSDGMIATRIYGLGAGTYKFSAYYKTTNTEIQNAFALYKRYNREDISDAPTELIVSGGNDIDWTLVTQEFTIEPSYRDVDNDSAINRICDGYSNNVSYLELRLYAGVGETTSITLPQITKI